MKIAVVTPSYPPYHGGTGNVAKAFAEHLSQLGHQVQVFTPKLGAEEEVSGKIMVHRLPPLISYRQAAFLPKLFWLLKGFDIIHLHFPFFGGSEVLLPLMIFSKSKFILHYHFDTVGRGSYKVLFWLYHLIFTPLLVRYSDVVISTSKDYLDHSLIKRWRERWPDKFKIVANGVDYKFFAKENNLEYFRDDLKINHDTKVVLFVGALDRAHYFKGVEVLLTAWQKIKGKSLDSIKLLIIGRGELKDSYATLAKQMGVSRSVLFLDQVPNDKLPFYYQLADITVLPSIDKSEAYGLVLIESMAAGTPVIASNLPGVRSLVVKEKTGWLTEPGSSDNLMFRIENALKDKYKLNAMGEFSKNYAKQYDWVVLTKELEKIMLSI